MVTFARYCPRLMLFLTDKRLCPPHLKGMSLMAAARLVHVKVKATSPLIDSRVDIKISSLQKSQKYTLALGLAENKSIWVSHAHFVSDENGTIELSRDASIGGTYTGLDSMGLFWSMQPAAEHTRGMRLIKKNVLQPFTYKLGVLEGHIKVDSVKSLDPDVSLATEEIQRYYHDASQVNLIPVREGRIRAELFVPKNKGPMPAVIDMAGSGGGLVSFRGALLASKGFVVLSLAYFQYEDLPKELEVDMEYFDEAVDFLISHPKVLSGGIGVMGNSKGAEIVLHMAAYNPNVRAVAAINGVYFYSYGVQKVEREPIFNVMPDFSNFMFEPNLVIMKPGYYTDCSVDPRAILPVEKIPDRCQVLFIQSEDDMAIGFHHYPVLCERLKAAGKSNYQLLSYPGAGHLLEPPCTPVNDSCYHGVFGINMKYGGIPALHAKAQDDYWHQIEWFFRDNLPKITQNFTVSKSQL